MMGRWGDMLTYRATGDLLHLAPGTEIVLPGVWETSPPMRLRIREIQPAQIASPQSCWAHCIDELGRPIPVYVTAPLEG